MLDRKGDVFLSLKRRARNWFNDQLLTLIVKNSTKLLSGNVIATVLGLLSLALVARAIGPDNLGKLVLISTYAAIVDRLINFQSWQALIKYGAHALKTPEPNDFQALVKFGTVLDGSTAVFGAAAAYLLAGSVARWLDMDEVWLRMAQLYSVSILFNLSGTPTAILRLYGKFNLLAFQSVIASGLRLLGVLAAFVLDSSLWGYMLAWLVAGIAGNLVLLAFGWRELYLQNISGVLSSSLNHCTDRFTGIWTFVWTTNIDGVVRAARELDVFIIGRVLNHEAVGFYNIAKHFSAAVLKLTDAYYQAVYPELAKLIAKSEIADYVKLMLRSSLLLGAATLAMWIVFLLAGRDLIVFFVGSGYSQSYQVTAWCLLAMVVWGFAQPMSPGMLAIGKTRTMFKIHLMATAFYLPVMYLLVQYFKVTGAGIALFLFFTLWATLVAISLTANIKKLQLLNTG